MDRTITYPNKAINSKFTWQDANSIKDVVNVHAGEIASITSSFLGTLSYLDDAPTGVVNGVYEFSDGNGVDTECTWLDSGTIVNSGDRVAYIVDPESYTYIPLSLESTVKVSEQTLTDEQQLQVRDNIGVTDLIIGELGTSETNVINQKKVTEEINTINYSLPSLTIEQSKNLFNKNDVTNNIVDTDGSLLANADFRSSDYIPVTPSTNLFAPAFSVMAQYNSSKVFIPGTYVNNPSAYISTNAECAYVRISCYYTILNTFQLEYGTAASGYVAYSRVIKCTNTNGESEVNFKPDITDTDLLNLFYTKGEITLPVFTVDQSKNLFDKSTATNQIIQSNGTLSSNADFRTSAKIPVTPETNVFAPAGSVVAQYDINDSLISGTYISNPSTYFTTDADCIYIRASCYYTVLNTFQVEYGTAATAYASYYRRTVCSQIGEETGVYFKPDVNDSELLALLLSDLYGGKYLAIGDSVTAALKYQTYIADYYNMELTTHALGGIALNQMVDGYSTLAALTDTDVEDKQLITILGGLNNRGQIEGDIDDIYPAQSTICGELNYVLNTILALLNTANNSSCKIVVLLPYKCGKYSYIDADGDDEYPIGSGQNLYTITRLMKQVCEKKGIPAIDLYAESGINQYNWNLYSITSLPTNQYTYVGNFATVGSLPSGVLNDAARVTGVTNAYIHNGTTWALGSTPYPWNADQLHLSTTGHERIYSLISAKLKSLFK